MENRVVFKALNVKIISRHVLKVSPVFSYLISLQNEDTCQTDKLLCEESGPGSVLCLCWSSAWVMLYLLMVRMSKGRSLRH